MLFSFLDKDSLFKPTAKSAHLATAKIRICSRDDRKKLLESENRSEYVKTMKNATAALPNKFVYVAYDSITNSKALQMTADLGLVVTNFEKRIYDYDLGESFKIAKFDDNGQYVVDAPFQDLFQDHDQYTCGIVAKWVADIDRCAIEPQVLIEMEWSGTLLMNSCDAELARLVRERLDTFDVRIRGYGPLIFKVIAELIFTVDDGVLNDMSNAARLLKLSDFEGENVTKAIQVLKACRQRLRMLKRPLPDFATILINLYRGCSHREFRMRYDFLHINLHPRRLDADFLFQDGDENYRRFIANVAWIKVTRKSKGSAFQADADDSKPAAVSSTKAMSSSKATSGNKSTGNKKQPKTHDASGRPIDRTPPKAGQSHSRVQDGKEEHWCSLCKRWGNHLDPGHQAFWDEFTKGRNKPKSNGSTTPHDEQKPGSETLAFPPPKQVNFAGGNRTGNLGPL
jgi:hypothetical protein